MTPRWILLPAIFAAAAHAEIIDRIAVTLDKEVITASEVTQAIRLTAFLNGDALDFSPKARRQAAERLIEQRLIRREIELGRYAQPLAIEVEPMLQRIQAQRFPGKQDYQDALAKYGIAEQELKEHLMWQITLIRFTELRFSAGVQITDEDVRKYFSEHVPSSADRSESRRKFAGMRAEIKQKLTNDQIDVQMDEWLKEARKRAHVEFRPEVFP